MTKLGWALVNKKDSLWVKFIREKYKAGMDLIPKVEKRRSESSTWRGIRNNWNVVKDSVAWRVSNGQNTSFWRDMWVPQLDKLENLATRALPQGFEEWKVADCVTISGQWEWQKFEHLLPHHVIMAIKRIHVHPALGSDFPVWRWSSDGNFSLKSAYYHITRHLRSFAASSWKFIWKIKVPQRYRLFLWLCAHGRLSTNYLRFQRGLHPSGLCDICRGGRESVLHVLRDCPTTYALWERCVPRELVHKFFASTDSTEWLGWCLRQRELVQGFEFKLWFAVLSRHIWLARNDHLFNGQIWSVEMICARTQACLALGVLGHSLIPAKPLDCDIWEQPPSGLVKINVDGSWSESSGLATCGGLLRNHDGEFLLGFQYKVGVGSAISAEAWGVLWGLKLSWDRGLRHVILESDSSEVLQLIQSSVSVGHPDYSVLVEIQAMLARDWDVELVWCSRDANSVADAMAHEARSMVVDLRLVHSPSDWVMRLLRADLVRLSSRVVSVC